jgi:DNA-binding XRE family transcriptional regulator
MRVEYCIRASAFTMFVTMTIQSMVGAGIVPPITQPTRLRIAREYAGLDQAEFAARAGIARGTVSAIEKGHRAASKATLNLWSFATGVSLDWLRYGDSPRPDETGAVGEECTPSDLNREPTD